MNHLQDTLTCLVTILSSLKTEEMRSCLKTSHERSVLSQSTPDDDEIAASVQQMDELIETSLSSQH